MVFGERMAPWLRELLFSSNGYCGEGKCVADYLSGCPANESTPSISTHAKGGVTRIRAFTRSRFARIRTRVYGS